MVYFRTEAGKGSPILRSSASRETPDRSSLLVAKPISRDPDFVCHRKHTFSYLKGKNVGNHGFPLAACKELLGAGRSFGGEAAATGGRGCCVCTHMVSIQ